MNVRSRPIVGATVAFTGRYQASRVLYRFVELLNVRFIKGTVTKPKMIEAGTTLASAEFCLPLRVYIGHVYNLLTEHPEIEYLLAPIINSEHENSSTCAKYRDLDGVIIRSLSSMSGYRLKQSQFTAKEDFFDLVGSQKSTALLDRAINFPKIIAPEINSLEKNHLRQVCGRVYAEIFSMSKLKLLKFLSSKSRTDVKDEDFRAIEIAFAQAYQEIVEQNSNSYANLINDVQKPRLALVGRSYLVDDPALSADIKGYFSQKGISVITAQDLPFEDLQEKYQLVKGFYDSHRLSQAFIDEVLDEVDGFILIGSFGCHPDAFQIEFLANYLREKGKTCWTFKFDEQAGGVGFHTRFETILGFLQQKRDERLFHKAMSQPSSLAASHGLLDFNLQEEYQLVNGRQERKPIFIWPYMGEGINLLLKGVWQQLGLQGYLYPPKAVNEETIVKGNVQYTETCSPFALYLGSLKETIERLLVDLKKQGSQDYRLVEPRRIIILMAGGKGPCTFGWYAIAGQKALLEEYREVLKRDGHTLEMISIDNQGRNLFSFLEDLAAIAENDRLQHLLELLQQIQGKSLNALQKTRKELEVIKLLKQIVWPGWQKLLAFETILNKALVVRAHELQRGSTTKFVKVAIAKLDQADTLVEIQRAAENSLMGFSEIAQDKQLKPKVVVVGEIYVSLTSFANRGTVDNLLGELGIEAVAGMRLSHFIKGAFKGLKNSYFNNQQLLKPILNILEDKGMYNPRGWVREPLAKPFLEHEIGGDGQPTVARARVHIEQDIVDGILHIYPFKCMPEGIAKDALIEMSQLYNIKSLHLSFDKETEIERLKTELGTFAALLQQDLDRKGDFNWLESEQKRRTAIGKTLEEMYKREKQLQKI